MTSIWILEPRDVNQAARKYEFVIPISNRNLNGKTRILIKTAKIYSTLRYCFVVYTCVSRAAY